MSTYLDLETDRYYDDEECRECAEWLTIKFEHSHVAIRRDDIGLRGVRRVDPSAGISFRIQHIDAVIDALVRIRADLPSEPSSRGEKP